MRSTKEIKAEIKALKKLKPIGPFASKTGASILAAIEELSNGRYQ